MKYTLDWKEYATKARQAVAEGCVLLKNDNAALPVKEGSKVALFGRIQFDYYKSGTGSGGMVNAPYVVSILDALKEENIELNDELLKEYESWVEKHPYNKGKGWAAEPWCQQEMELSDETVNKAASTSQKAVIIIGRTAGEDQDNTPTEGSYLLTSEERDMIKKVCSAFKETIVVLNVGNIIDMKWVDEFNPSAVLYTWQGGSEGGHGVADVLMGRVNPCGKLADTIAYDCKDYPSTANFNKDKDKIDRDTTGLFKRAGKVEIEDVDVYEEDIYVGYRYFETAAKDRVMYPFGFGMSYTSFDIDATFSLGEEDKVVINATVTNTGNTEGKEVVQIYCEPPQGKLLKPVRNLVGFDKTDIIKPGKKQQLTWTLDMSDMASYDDGGYTGHKNCYVLEAGEYVFYAGSDVRKAVKIGSFDLADTIVVEKLSEALAPVKEFDRLVIRTDAGKAVEEKQPVPTRTIDIKARIENNCPASRECTGDKGYKFADVMNGQVTIEEFIDQMTDLDLIHMSRGEGMSSNKVTPGIAGSYGGVTKRLNEHFGMPVAGLSDGPSGIRMDCGSEAFAMPNGTALACSFNKKLVEELYGHAAEEMRFNKIDSLLGPGINIHRNPLNGRNFEYFSEDPYLTGKMTVAVLKGLHSKGVTGTIKHFAANNREFDRNFLNSIVSQRALREIYLKAFEMAVKEAGAYNIMSTYGLINGTYTAGNYDLNTTILRDEWGFDGIVMTDWWARIGDDGEDGTIEKTGFMIRAQNDVYEVTADSESNANNDDSEEMLKKGVITRGDLLRNARNIVSSLMKTPVADRIVNGEDDITQLNRPKSSRPAPKIMPAKEYTGGVLKLDVSQIDTTAGHVNQFPIRIDGKGKYVMNMKIKSDLSELSQTSMSISINNLFLTTLTIHGTNGEWIEKEVEFEVFVSIDNYLDLAFAQTGIDVDSITVTLKYMY